MKKFIIMTDACSDLTTELQKSLDIIVLPMTVTLGSEDFKHYTDYREKSFKDFFDAMRNGRTASTSAISPFDWEERMEEYLSQGFDILVMPFSSALSVTHDNALMAKKVLAGKYPDRQIEVVDTFCVSLGLILLLKMAAEYRAEGLTLTETTNRIEEDKQRIYHNFTVEDLSHLRRGGRISAAKFVIGTALNINPVLHLTPEGKIEPSGKARGRNAALNMVLDQIEKNADDLSEQPIVIVHGDCLDEAEELSGTIKERFGTKEVIIGQLGPVIGAHTGPGLIAVCHTGRLRAVNN
jgi:DegV family protein with EDD domain